MKTTPMKLCKAAFYLVIFILICPRITQAENMKSVWEPFNRWFEWKKTTNLTKEQRDVIVFLKQAGGIKKKAKELTFSSSEINIKLIQKCFNKLKILDCPKICKKYRDSLAEELLIYLDYAKAKIAKRPDDEIQTIQRKILTVDGVQFVAFFQAIKDVGLYDNLEEEIKNFK